jgi:hypothetical protein
MIRFSRYLILVGGLVLSFFTQQPPRRNAKTADLRAQSPSTVSLTSKGDEQTLEITNVTYETTSDSVPGRPSGERLLLRKTTCSKQVLGDKGQEATTLFEAWPLGAGLGQKPLYSIKVSGVGGETVDGALIMADRGLEEVGWWSIYRLGTGQHLFDTYVPLVSFSISTEVVESRYIGLEVPPDDVADARLKPPDVVAVITYSSEERVKREALLTCDDAKRAPILRSYWDATRKVSLSEGVPPRSVRVAFRANSPLPLSTLSVTIPIANDDLDIAHAQLPAHLHLAAWKR